MTRTISALGLGIWMAAAAAWGQQADRKQGCNGLAKVSLPHTTILKAERIGARKWVPAPDDKSTIYRKLPAFCRVRAEAHPSADSQIEIEVWLPLTGWNGKFLGTGNGGFAGTIGYESMAHVVRLGYASAGTDTGHSTEGAEWALNHPEKIADYGYRGIHEMTLTGEALAQAFYGRAPEHRYFSSCSDGGREALMEAERFPEDYDGILAGAPANNWTHLLSGGLGVYLALIGDASYIPATKIPAIGAAVLAQCNPGNGQDFLDDPRTCHFDPGAMLCKGAENDQCLTGPQVTALKALYAGVHTADGSLVLPGYLPGAEEGGNGWASWIAGTAAGKSYGAGYVLGYFSDMVYSKPDLDLKTLNVDDALRAADTATGDLLNSASTDLTAFRARGGKLILYHGWNDAGIPALGTVDYYNRVVEAAGEQQAAGFVRLFMAPGMQHCAGGPGPVDFGQWGPDGDAPARDADHNIYLAMEAWVESGKAPERIVAAKLVEKGRKSTVKFTRPLCAYPLAAKYKGAGDRNDAASYECAAE